MIICSIYGGGAAGRLVPHVPASMRRSVRNMRAKELVRNERAGGANAIPNRGVMRIDCALRDRNFFFESRVTFFAGSREQRMAKWHPAQLYCAELVRRPNQIVSILFRIDGES